MKISKRLYPFIYILAFMSFFLSARATHAAIFYVAPNGNDTNPGTAALPFRTILKGVRTLAAGDTLLVKGGTYAEGLSNIPSGSSGSPTTIQVAPGETVTLRPADGRDCVIEIGSNQSYVTIDGMSVDASNQSGNTICSGFTAHHIILKNLEAKNARNSGINVGGSNLELRNLHVHNNGTDPSFSHGIYFQGDHSLIIGNLIHDNQGYGLQNFSSAGANPTDNIYMQNKFYNQPSGGVWLAQGQNHLFINNIIYSTATQPDSGAFVFGAPNSNVYNNTVYNNGHSGMVNIGNDTGSQIKNNIAYQNPAGNIIDFVNAVLSNNLTTNPSFVDPANGNLNLRAGSPAIDAGVTGSLVPNDFDGMPRPQGAGYDIGAYEYRTSNVPVPAPRNLRLVGQP